jgi:thiol:disulfide interchange protein DsbA
MLRRRFLLSGALLGLAPLLGERVLGAAQEGSGMSPFEEVGPFGGDRKLTYGFFDFSCPVCRQLHPTFANWSASLPASRMAFRYSPIAVMERSRVAGARGFLAAQRIMEPARLHKFMEGVFALHQDHGRALDSPETWLQSVRYAGGSVKAFQTEWQAIGTKDLLTLARRMVDYNIRATPSLGIGGRFVITPDSTSGDMGLFIQLANGLVSKSIA